MFSRDCEHTGEGVGGARQRCARSWQHCRESHLAARLPPCQSKVQPPIDRGTFQTMAANEMVNLPQKGEKAVWMRWLAALHVAGNEYPAWEDSSGSLRRRA